MYIPYLSQRSALSRYGPALLLTTLLLLGLTLSLALHAPTLTDLSPASIADLELGRLPLAFIPNAGQADPAVRFQAHDGNSALFFTPDAIVLALPATTGTEPSVVRLRFEGANPAPTVTGVERLPGIVNYFLGDDPTRWYTNLPTYAGVVYQGLYPGIDLRYEGTNGSLKSTYLVAPGADPSLIRWRHEGATALRLDGATGDLLVTVAGSTLIEQAPIAWQEINGQRLPVAVRYVLGQDGTVGFALDRYDPAYPLAIDPTLSYGTYLGGTGPEEAEGIAVDDNGNAYVVGTTYSSDFPITTGAYQTAFQGGTKDVFVVKINAAGDTLVYSTFLGGSDDDEGNGIVVDASGNAYIAGATQSTDFPTQSAFQADCALMVGVCTGDAFVTKLNADGDALVYSTYLGGKLPDEAKAIAVDASGNAYVTGMTTSGDFPTQNPLYGPDGGSGDAFVAKLKADGSALVYSTFLGGSATDAGLGIAVDASGSAYVVGDTNSADFPTTTGAFDTTCGTDGDCDSDSGMHPRSDLFVAKLKADGSALVYSTFLGGSDEDHSHDIAVDGSGSAYVTGRTKSADFPTTAGAFDTTCGTDGDCNPGVGYGHEGSDAFVAKLEADGSDLAYSTFLGGSGDDKGHGIAVDAGGYAYVTGDTYSDDFPTQDAVQSYGGETDAFVAKLETDGSDLVYSTFLGGSSGDYGMDIALDSSDNAYVTGVTGSGDFPTQDPLQAAYRGNWDAFVVKLGTGTTPPPTPSPNLSGSHKAASRYTLTSGETLTYTIRLVNSGTLTATADVTDPVPAEMSYIAGSATGGGSYDAGTATLTWSGVTVPPGSTVDLAFAVTATTVTSPTIVTNTATIAADGDTFDRSVWVLLLPTSAPPRPNLRGSHKLASQHTLSPGETLTYTIRLHNSSTVTATADVTDPVPAELAYVTGSATGGGSYDAGTATLTWSGVTVPPGSTVDLAFAVTPAGTVLLPTPVINEATITADGDTFRRRTGIVLLPAPPVTDTVPPVVHSLTIDGQDVLTSPTVTLHISATDNVAVTEMYLQEWFLATRPFPHWTVVQTSGWIPYQESYTWTLTSESGTHYVGVWVADAEGNTSRLDRKGLDYASLLLPGESVDRGGLVPYLVHYNAGDTVVATLTTLSGDADLYVWFPGNFGWPDEYSINPGTVTDTVSFTAPTTGTYLFLVYGWEASTYDFSITPGGGPRAWAMALQSDQIASEGMSANAVKVPLSTDPILTWSGLDPLSEAQAPSRYTVYLPLVMNQSSTSSFWPTD